MDQSIAILRSNGPRNLSRVVAFLSVLPTDKDFDLTIKERKRRRSNEQNAYLWGVCYATILKHLPGWDADDLHEYFLGEHFGWETLEGMGRKRLKPIRRSSKLNKLEFADFIGFVQRKAAEFGVFIPDAQ